MIEDNKIKDGDKYIVFEVSGGHGKTVQSTAVIRQIKKQYPDYKIVVVCSWDAAYFYNPNVFRFYLHSQLHYFKDDFLNDSTIIFKQDPYNETNHILRKEHLVETWCKLVGVEYENNKPELFINPREIEIAKDKIKPDGRPIMLLQTHGGGTQQYSKKSWYRDMPIETANKIVEHYKNKYRILHLRLPEQPSIQGTEMLNLPLRELYAVFPLSTKRLFIDSFAQHVSSALNLQSVVIWIGNSPNVFGYENNINILPKAEIVNNFNKYTYLIDDISGQIQQFPYNNVDVFHIDDIINAIDIQK